MRQTVLALAILFAVLPVEGGSADWPQWRGANRDAISPETGLVDVWTEDGPRVLWRIDIGPGYSSVTVSDGKLYTMWDKAASQYLFCLDGSSGEELWRFSLGKTFRNHYGNGPRVTPVVDGELVYAVGTDGLLVAVNKASGELVWRHDLPGEFGTKLPTYGFSSSPMVVGARLLIEAGGKGATFMAFDKKTGELAWSSQSDRPAYSSPIDVSIDGVRQVVFWSAHGLHAVAPDDGKLLWKHSWETFCPVTGDPLNTGTPIFVPPDRIFISSGSGAALLRISREAETFEVEPVWKSEHTRSDVNTAVRLGNYIYGFDRSILQCLDVRTGEVKWQARGFGRGSLIAADGKLFVLGEAGNLAIVAASPDGFVQKGDAEVLSGNNWTSPSIAGGRLYLRNHEELVCVDVKG